MIACARFTVYPAASCSLELDEVRVVGRSLVARWRTVRPRRVSSGHSSITDV